MHPQLVRIENLVRRLEAAMEDATTEGVDKSLFPLAAEYSELCKKANDRLETCAEILSAGKDKEYQALMAATRSPDLLDLCATLGELEAEEYRDFCRENHLPLADAINESAKQTIDPIYSRAGSFEKALMSEYSAANSKRDFREALRIIRQVASLNPADLNSVQQAAKLEDRLVSETVKKLETPLREENPAEILDFLDELEELAPGRVPNEKKAGERIWSEALELRRDLEREAAIESSGQLLTEAQLAKDAGNLHEVLTLVGRVNELTKVHEFALRPNQRDIHTKLEKWSSDELRNWREKEQHKERLASLESSVKTIRDKDFQRIKPDLPELQEDALSIRRQWKDISEARKPVPETLQDEARRTLADLEEKISVKQRAKRRNLIALITGGSFVLIALAATAFLFWKAGQKEEQIERALAGKRASDLERNLDQLDQQNPVWRGFGNLSSTVEKARSWLNLEIANADRVNTMIQGLENDFKATPNPDDWTPVSLAAARRSIDQSRQQAASVNPDYQSDMTTRMSVLERTYDQITEAKRNKIAPEFHSNVVRLDQLIRTALTGKPGSSEVASASTEAGNLISNLDAAAGTDLDELKPLAADLTTFEILKEKYSSLEADIELSRELNTGLENAPTLTAYADALTKLENSNLVAGTEKIAIGNIIRKIHSDDVVLREILMPGNLVRWTQLKDGNYTEAGFPAGVKGSEKPLFLGLRDDASLGKIHSYRVNEPGKSRTIYSRSSPLDFRNSKIGDMTQVEAIGKEVYDPAKSGNRSATFGPESFRSRISATGRLGFVPENGGLSPESTFFQTLRLDGFVDPSISHYRDSFLETIEDIYVAEENISPLFKAFVQLKIGELMRQRRNEWLLDFSPYDLHHEELLSLTANGSLKSDSWMVPDEIERFSEPLSAFYTKHRGIEMAKQAEAAHLFFKTMRASGIVHCGFINGQKNVRIVTDTISSNILWGLTQSLEFRPILRKVSGEWKNMSDYVAFSPVFHFAKEPEAALEESAKSALLDPKDEFYLKQIPDLLKASAP